MNLIKNNLNILIAVENNMLKHLYNVITIIIKQYNKEPVNAEYKCETGSKNGTGINFN